MIQEVSPAAADVDLWWFQVSAVLPDDALPRWPLTTHEQAQWSRLRRSDDRRRFLASRLVQYAVGEFYAGVPVHIPRRCARCGEPHGRPCWRPCRPIGHAIKDSGTLDYSVSHAGDQLLIAVVGAGSVGVDVESISGVSAAADLPALDVAAGVLTPGELAELSRTAADSQAALLLRWWTRKEAAVKAAGVGLMVGLDEIDVRGTRALVPGGVGAAGGSVAFHLTQLAAPVGYAAALAYSPAQHPPPQYSPAQHPLPQESPFQHSDVRHSGVRGSMPERSSPTIRIRTAESDAMCEAICRATTDQEDLDTFRRRQVEMCDRDSAVNADPDQSACLVSL